MNAKIWYAVQKNRDDNDWGTGSFEYDEAVEMAKKYGSESVIAAIDAGYDEDGNETADPICVAEFVNGTDF